MLEKFFKTESDTPLANDPQLKEAERQLALDNALTQIAALSDEQSLATIAIESPFTKVRQGAAEKIVDARLLHDIEKNSQDKAVQHRVREKIKLQKQAITAQEQATELLEGICLKLANLAKSSHSPLFKQQFQYMVKEWQEQDSHYHRLAKTALEEKFNAAQQACKHVLAEYAEEEARLEAAREAEATLAEKREADKILSAQEAEAKQAEIEQAALKKQQSEEHKKKLEQQQQNHAQALKDLLPVIETALQEGQIHNADKKLKNAQKKLEALDKKTAHHYEGKLQLLHKQLLELRDWQGFAALPKKQELCSKMEKLLHADLPLPARADAVHDLQEQWRALKGGGQAEEQKVWLQFKEASDKAYEPCKQYFEQQKSTRAENLRQRENICAELEKYYQTYNWAAHENNSIDWRAVDKIIETAKQEFHRFSPVDHKSLESIKARYAAAIKPIIEKLRSEQKNNETKKQQLIEQAKKLLEGSDTPAAIEGAKKLQQQWKTIGLTRPREDQKLWQQFRNACDAIFSRRNTEKEQAQENLKLEITNAEEICKKIEVLASLEDSELQKSKEAYNELRKQFQSINSLSKEKQQKLFRHFYKICDHYQQRVDGIKDRKQQSASHEAYRKAHLCEQLETGAALADIEAQWASDIALSNELENTLKKRYEQAKKIGCGEATANFIENEKQRRLILIQLEILLEKPTPEEDKQLRMTYQLTQLSKGLGKASKDKKEGINTLKLEWLGCGTASPDVRESLQQRFLATLGMT